MARKPAPSLPDVFARPGAAPSRGTALEDLPLVIEPPPPPKPSAPAAAAETVHAAPPPEQLPHVDDMRQPAPDPEPPRPQRSLALAGVALAVALTAPFWQDGLLSALGIRTPIGRAAEQSTLVALRQERRTEDISQRLAAAIAALARQQAEFTAAIQRVDHAATLIRTMALVRLSEALRRPVPFAAELAVARASGNDLGDLKPLLDQIAPYADTGIPGSTQLRQEFRTLLDQAPRGGRGGSASWMTSLASWARLRAAPAVPVEADGSFELLQSASARLADVDMAGAVQDVRQVADAYRAPFANWMGDAQARVAADTLAERVSDMVTQALRGPEPK